MLSVYVFLKRKSCGLLVNRVSEDVALLFGKFMIVCLCINGSEIVRKNYVYYIYNDKC